MVADEVQRRQHGLVRSATESPTELLQEDGGTLRGSQEQHSVDVGQVNALIKDIDREDDVDPAFPQVDQRPIPVLLVRFSGDRLARAHLLR